MSKNFFIDCDEATAICNKRQYKEASFWELVKLNFHILQCKICSLYSKQNGVLTKVCNTHLHKHENQHKLCEEEKAVLQSEVVKRLK